MDNSVKNILLCGVGGQGTILASKILSTALVDAGFDVKMSEVHGMAQRGGSVTTQVRFGEKVYSPIIGRGAADIIVAFEVMEALRYLEMLKPDGKVVVNEYRIPSSTILSGIEKYPADALETVRSSANTFVLDAKRLAESIGGAKAMNTVLLGALVQLMGLEGLNLAAAVKKCVKPAFAELNIKALETGMASVTA
jgi:indolepyruvate ferredoxin oxidoreductase beta subunit